MYYPDRMQRWGHFGPEESEGRMGWAVVFAHTSAHAYKCPLVCLDGTQEGARGQRRLTSGISGGRGCSLGPTAVADTCCHAAPDEGPW